MRSSASRPRSISLRAPAPIHLGQLQRGARHGAHVVGPDRPTGRGLGVDGERADAPPRHAGGQGVLTHVRDGVEGRRAQQGLQVDRGHVAGRGVRPARAQELLAGGHQVVRPGAHPLGVADQHHRALGQHVDEQLHAVHQGRGQRLHALDRDALGDLVEHVPHAGQLVGELAGPGPDGVGEQQLATRRCPQPVLGDLEAALVGDREVPDLLDRVAPELHAQRVLLGGREDVQDAAADGEVAAPLDQVGARVGGCGQPSRDVVQVGRVTGPQPHRLQLAQTADHRLQHRPHRSDHDRDRADRLVTGLGVRQPAQHREPAADGVAARAEPLVRQRLPRGEVDHRVRRQEAAQRLGEVLGLARGRGDQQQRPGRARLRRGREGGRHRRPRAGRRGQVEGPAGTRGGPGRGRQPGRDQRRGRRGWR